MARTLGSTSARLKQRQQAPKKLRGLRWTSANVEIDGQDTRNSSFDCVAIGKDSAVDGAVADSDDPFGVWSRGVSPDERFSHIFGNRPRNEQNVRVPGGCDKANAEAFEIIERVVQCMNFQLTAVARAGVHFSDSKTPTETPARHSLERRGEFGERVIVRGWGGLRQWSVDHAIEQQFAHASAP